MTDYNLLDKTELSISGISLQNADLGQIAEVVAGTLNLERNDLLVTDVRGDNLVVDILKRGVDANDIVGRQEELLQRLGGLGGVEVTERTTVSSRGLLSWVALDAEEGREALKKSEAMAAEILERLKKTAVVFSTGAEVAKGQILDTNTPAIRERLRTEGYSVRVGPTLSDDDVLIAAHLRDAAEDGYGLVVTTGGVGAEDKDRTVEAVLMLDPDAATPQIVTYELGVGRHKHKNSVRIAVGRVLETLIVALPGPNDEVQLGLNALMEALAAKTDKNELAEAIAGSLRQRFKEKIDKEKAAVAGGGC